ncbi:MAG: isochorismate synthase [candidate division Zixibacteria bacterium]|nr:isochorismate synthase [candidate division Zixibacteria bacterium]
MASTTPRDTGRDFENAARILAGKIQAALSGPNRSDLPRGGVAIRLQVALPPLEVLDWLSGQNQPTRIYWRDRNAGFETAGVGTACGVDTPADPDLGRLFDRLRNCLPAADVIRFYGGMAFDRQPSNSADRDWALFPRCHFVIPRFELTAANDGTFLACHLLPDRDRDNTGEILRQLDRLAATPHLAPVSLPKLAERVDTPNKSEWYAMIGDALDDIGRKNLEKIVLARKTSLRFADRLDPMVTMKHMKSSSAGCYHYCFQMTESAAFLGASPEKLFSRCRDEIESEALAGTRPRGESEEDDEALARELLTSSKDMREQQYVADHVTEALRKLCRAPVERGPRQVVKLAGVQHLCTSFRGKLAGSVSDAEILGELHPTPAVAGTPTRKALERLSRLEPFDRGWYAGPVGWVSHDAAEFAVGIRSALIAGSKLHGYAGAGIVAGSRPEDEWHEIENKLDNLLKVVESS